MSNPLDGLTPFTGAKVNCPGCGKDLWKVVDWETYLTVVCVNCLYHLGDLTNRDGLDQ